MNTNTFELLERLKGQISEEMLTWVFIALQEDPITWSSLRNDDFYTKALAQAGSQPASWSPGGLSLIALGNPTHLAVLQAQPMRPLKTELRQLAAQTFEASSECQLEEKDAAESLAHAGLLALALRERLRLTGSWQGLAEELHLYDITENSKWKTPLACLYAFIPDPGGLINALCQAGCAELGLHVLLSNPLPLQEQLDILLKLVSRRSGSGFERPKSDLRIIQQLAFRRPQLACSFSRRLAEDLTSNVVDSSYSLVKPGTTFMELLEEQEQIALFEKIFELAGDHQNTRRLLDQAKSQAGLLQAELASRWAKISDNDLLQTVEAWKQAVDLDPRTHLPGNNSPYKAGYIAALVRAGQLSEAQTCLEGSEPPTDQYPSEVLIELARQAYHRTDILEASKYAVQALNMLLTGTDTDEIETAPSADQLGQIEFLAQLLFDLDQFDACSQAAQTILAQIPGHVDMLCLLGQSRMALHDSPGAIEALQAVTILKPRCPEYRDLYAESLELNGKFRTALSERSASVSLISAEESIRRLNALRKLAACALQAHHPQLASDASQEALQIEPEDGLANTYLGQANIALGEIQEGMHFLTQATQYAPEIPETWLALAAAQNQTGQPYASLETLRATVQAIPGSAELYLALGEAYQEQGALTQALNAFEQAYLSIGQIPDRREFRLQRLYYSAAFHLGNMQRILGHLADSENVLGNAILHFGSQPHLVYPELVYAYAQTLLAVQKAEIALPLLANLIECGQQDVDISTDYAAALLATDQSPQKAAELLQAVLHQNPVHARAQGMLAEALAACGSLPDAMRAYQRALETELVKEPGWLARLSLGLGRVALDLKLIETALAALQEAAQAAPNNPVCQRTLAEACWAAGLSADAVQAARNAMRLDPTGPETILWFADQVIDHFHQPNINTQKEGVTEELLIEAQDSLEYILQLEPESASFHLRLGQIQALLKDEEGAAFSLNKAIVGVDASPEELGNAAKLLLDLQMPQSAITGLEKAVSLAQSKAEELLPDLLELLSQAYQENGDVPSTLTTLEKALAIAPDNTRLYMNKANLLQRLGHFDEALTCLEMAIDHNPRQQDFPELHFRMAILLRAKGELRQALTQAERSVSTILKTEPIDENSQEQPKTIGVLPSGKESIQHLAACALAADLSRSLLMPERARAYLSSEADIGKISELVTPEYLPACLAYYIHKAENALEEGRDIDAAGYLEFALLLSPHSAPSLAIKSRLQARKNDMTAALDTLQEALLKLSKPKPGGENQEPTADWIDMSMPSSYIGVAESAREIGQWDSAIYLLRQAQQAAPYIPQVQFCFAKTLVLRGEFQHLCNSADVITHAPGQPSLSDYACCECESALNAVEENPFVQITPGSNLSALLMRWKGRSQAVFETWGDSGGALLLEQIPDTQRSAEDTQSLLDALRRRAVLSPQQFTGQERADRTSIATKVYPRSPAVLVQAALLLADTSPQEALLSAHAAANLAGERGDAQAAICFGVLAKLSTTNHDFVAALRAVESALEIWSDEPRWHALAADICLSNEITYDGDTQAKFDTLPAAIAHLEKAVKLEPQCIDHHLALGDAYQQATAQDPQLLKRAVRTLERACRMVPNQPEVWLALSKALMAAGDELNLTQATKSAERALELAKNSGNRSDVAPPNIRLAEIALRNSNAQKAYWHALSALEAIPGDPQAVLVMTQSLEKLNHPEDALEALDRALPYANDLLDLKLTRIRLIAQIQGTQSAQQELEQLLRDHPDHPAVSAALAKVLAENGKYPEAIQIAQRTLQSNNGNLPEEEKAKLHHLLGNLFHQNGQLDQAVYHLTETTHLSPNNLEAYLDLGEIYQDQRQHNKALAVFKQATSVAPHDPRPYVQAGMAMKDGKDYRGAESMLRKAVELAPGDVNIRRKLAGVVAMILVRQQPNNTGIPTV